MREIIISVKDNDFKKICQSNNLTEEMLKKSLCSLVNDYIEHEVRAIYYYERMAKEKAESGQLNLGELISRLNKEPLDKIVPRGFGNAYSYRGYYEQLAFEPEANVLVKTILAEAMKAKGERFRGHKGGAYCMDNETLVWLAEEGTCGEKITSALLEELLKE